MDRVEEEQRADALVEVVALPAKRIQLGALGEQASREPAASASRATDRGSGSGDVMISDS